MYMASQNIELQDFETRSIYEFVNPYNTPNMGNVLSLSWKQWLKFVLLTLSVSSTFSVLVLAATYFTVHGM